MRVRSCTSVLLPTQLTTDIRKCLIILEPNSRYELMAHLNLRACVSTRDSHNSHFKRFRRAVCNHFIISLGSFPTRRRRKNQGVLKILDKFCALSDIDFDALKTIQLILPSFEITKIFGAPRRNFSQNQLLFSTFKCRFDICQMSNCFKIQMSNST